MNQLTRSDSLRGLALPKLLAILFFAFISLAVMAQNQTRTGPAEVRLGSRLFHDNRFSSPAGDLMNSCSSCHLFDEDPQGIRARADFFSRSWVPFRMEDPRRDALRNSPTIFDVARMPRLHFDGEFASLEDLVKGTLAGRPMGWLEGEQAAALNRIRDVLLKNSEESGDYREDFKALYGVDIETTDRAKVVELVARAISAYMRTLNSEPSTPYDTFIRLNNLEPGPESEQDPKAFGNRLLERISTLEAKEALKLPAGFNAASLKGLKLFVASSGTSAGNCVTCHAPPSFTDSSFHNIGISQSEYDQINGIGSFAGLEIPRASKAVRPSARFRETPVKHNPGFADLGHWNFADLKTSSLRRPGETEDEFLDRMIGTFKTPTLRNLEYSPPYMHTGGYPTVESVVQELMRLSELARAAKVRSADQELARIRISSADIEPLTAFLKTLNQDMKKSAARYSR